MKPQTTPPTYVIFGPRVSDASKQAIRQQMQAEEIPVDFGPFGSGAFFCELFPFLKHEREGKSQQELDARRQNNLEKLKDSHVVFIESTGEQPDVSDSVERVRFMVRSLKRYGVGEVTLAMPSTAYERQDRGFAEQGRLCSEGLLWWVQDLKRYGVDRVINFAPHSQAGIEYWQQEFGETNYYPLQTTELFAGHIRKQFAELGNLVIGAPDGADKPNDQGQARASELAAEVHGRNVTDAELFRIGKAHTDASETKVTSFSGDVAGKDCVIIDDMSDGGSTLINAATTLKERGARSVCVYFTHAICSEKEKYLVAENTKVTESSLRKLASNPNIDRIVTTDTVPEIIDKRAALEPELRDKIDILPVGPQLARALNDMSKQQTYAQRVERDRGAANQRGV